MELEYAEAPELDDVREALTDAGYEDFVVQNFGSDTLVLIRMQEAGDDELGRSILADMQNRSDIDVELVSSEFVGSQVGDELKESSGLGMLLALAVVLIYVGMRFQFKFGIASVIPWPMMSSSYWGSSRCFSGPLTLPYWRPCWRLLVTPERYHRHHGPYPGEFPEAAD